MRVSKCVFLILALFINSSHIFGEFIPRSLGQKQTELEEILNKCAEYCEKLAKSALFFVCEERIQETVFNYSDGKGKELVNNLRRHWEATRMYRGTRLLPKSERNVYIYDYQLIKKGEKIEESRILLEENGEKRIEKNAKLKTTRFYSQRSVFGPVGLLSKQWQEQYNYSLMGEDKVDGKKAYVIEAIPMERIEERPNYGKIWIDKKDFTILKIEVAEESLKDYETIKEELKKYKIVPAITDVHFFKTVKNGIRFPSQTIIEEYYKGSFLGGKLKKSRTVVSYDNYRFFTVEVDVKY